MSDDDWNETPSRSSVGGGGGFGSGGFGGNTSNGGVGGGSFGGGSGGGGFGGGGGGFGGSSSDGGNGCRKCGEDGHYARECPKGGGSGRGCHKCGEEGHFARECPKGGRGCHKCGEEGHFARECPKGGRGCHKCGEEGHFARECTNSGGANSKPSGGFGDKPSGGFGGGGFRGGDDDTAGGGGGFGDCGGSSNDTCRICHQSGHFARECPNKPERDDKCRRCGESGHFARDCEMEPTLDPDRLPPVTYIPPEPSEAEEDLFRTIAQGINFNNYDNIPVEVTGPGEIPRAIRDFSEAGLPNTILENVRKAKYDKPTPVQKYALPIILGDRDLMSCAQTGSGKTAAFLLPVLTGMMKYKDELTSQLSEVQAPLALVVAPTRELAVQIFQEARKFSLQTSLRPVVVYGGVSVTYQLRQLQSGCHLLVGTPGRLKDFIGKRRISVENLKYLILDEADRMLDMGFMPDVKTIVHDFGMPSKQERHTLMFSATFPEQIQKLAAEFLNNYVYLTIGKVGGTHSDINQTVIEVDDLSKRDKLVEILGVEGGNRNLVFVQTKRLADFLASYLCQNGFPTTSIHGDRFQQQREEALREFRKGSQTVLVATAVAARGLDIDDIKQVINYDLPDEIEEYIHRIGRTGRIGNKGRATSFFSRGRDEPLARALVKTLADSEQVVPDWLEEVAESALGTGYGPKGGRFASKDTRGNMGSGVYNAVGNDDGWDRNGGGAAVMNGGGGGDEEWD